MDRPYEYEIDTLLDVIYFTGSEIEKTSAYGQKTLFVVGLQPIDEVVDVAIRQEVKHIYIGANQSFDYSCIDRHLEAWSAFRKLRLLEHLQVSASDEWQKKHGI